MMIGAQGAQVTSVAGPGSLLNLTRMATAVWMNRKGPRRRPPCERPAPVAAIVGRGVRVQIAGLTSRFGHKGLGAATGHRVRTAIGENDHLEVDWARRIKSDFVRRSKSLTAVAAPQ
jgi:hypothetical protein